MRRKQFLDTCRRALTQIEFDHEERTGLDEDHEMTFAEWLGEVQAWQENTDGKA